MTRLGPGAEFDLIRTLLARAGWGSAVEAADGSGSPRLSLPDGSIRVGPGDDALVLDGSPPLVVSTDLSVEDVHFRRDWVSLQEVGYRAVMAALSDLAAMAADPIGVLLSVAVSPQDLNEFEGLADGVTAALSNAGTLLLGGDLTTSPGPLALDVVVLGRSKDPLLRSGAQGGDDLWVTGRLGGSALAVRAWEAGTSPTEEARRAYCAPIPRIREAIWLRSRGVLRAGLDLSDGIAGDAGHLASASDVGIIIEESRIPVFRGSEIGLALYGGEDYELLLVAPPGALEPHRHGFEREFGISLTRVGRVEGQGGLVFLRDIDGETRPLSQGGFDHFQRSGDL